MGSAIEKGSEMLHVLDEVMARFTAIFDGWLFSIKVYYVNFRKNK